MWCRSISCCTLTGFHEAVVEVMLLGAVLFDILMNLTILATYPFDNQPASNLDGLCKTL